MLRRPESRRRAAWGGAILCVGLLWAGPAAAQLTPDEMAEQHFESGVAYLQEADYESALRAFEKAYNLSKRPKLLLNVATVHERMGNPEKAIETLELYLKEDPDATSRGTIEARIKNLRRRVDAPSEPEPAATAEIPPPPPSEPAGTDPAPPSDATAPATQPEPLVPAPPRRPDRTPAYIALGVAGGAAVGAVITNLLAGAKHSDLEDSCAPGCTDDDTQGGRTLAWTSLGLTGLAVVGAGVGAVLWFTSDVPDENPRTAATGLFVGVGATGGPEARATWSF